MIPYDKEVNDYGFQGHNIFDSESINVWPTFNTVDQAPIAYEPASPTKFAVNPVVDAFIFPVFEPIKISPVTFENINPVMTLENTYFPIIQPLFTTPIPIAPVFSTPTIDSKITISTMVYDEFGDPLPGANVHIDGKPIASTYNDGSVTVPGIATSTSTVRITYVGMKDYVISAVFLPKKVIMQVDVIALEGVTIIVPKKDTTVPYTAPVAKAGMSWLLWIALLAAGYKGMQYFKDDKPKTVKAKI